MISRIRVAFIASLLALAACTSTQQKQAQDAASAAPQQAADAVLAASVKTKLAAIDVDSATSVHVEVANGNVTLSGDVRNPAQRGVFENAARSVGGVTGVTDNTKINPKLRGARESLGDAALLTKVMGALTAQTGVNAFGVKGVSRDGTVTLYGHVSTQAIKTTMLETARKVNGVTSIIDKITIKS
ncbi:MAG: BON domain-containing protein [Candidatus Baltobacteraceae bacterium]